MVSKENDEQSVSVKVRCTADALHRAKKSARLYDYRSSNPPRKYSIKKTSLGFEFGIEQLFKNSYLS